VGTPAVEKRRDSAIDGVRFAVDGVRFELLPPPPSLSRSSCEICRAGHERRSASAALRAPLCERRSAHRRDGGVLSTDEVSRKEMMGGNLTSSK
jgi:hypothetical protein